jgi:hypothetical protein
MPLIERSQRLTPKEIVRMAHLIEDSYGQRGANAAIWHNRNILFFVLGGDTIFKATKKGRMRDAYEAVSYFAGGDST